MGEFPLRKTGRRRAYQNCPRLHRSLAVVADKWAQPNGKQDRRVLGEWAADGREAPDFKFTIKSLGAPVTEQTPGTDKKGRPVTNTLTYQTADALIEAGPIKLPVSAKCTVSWNAGGRDGSTLGCRVTAYMTVKGKDLVLEKLANEEIDIRITMQG